MTAELEMSGGTEADDFDLREQVKASGRVRAKTSNNSSRCGYGQYRKAMRRRGRGNG